MALRSADTDNYEVHSPNDSSISPNSPLLVPGALPAENDTLLTPITSGNTSDASERGVLAKTQDDDENERLGVQGQEARMQKSFSTFAALGLGFRYVDDS